MVMFAIGDGTTEKQRIIIHCFELQHPRFTGRELENMVCFCTFCPCPFLGFHERVVPYYTL